MVDASCAFTKPRPPPSNDFPSPTNALQPPARGHCARSPSSSLSPASASCAAFSAAALWSTIRWYACDLLTECSESVLALADATLLEMRREPLMFTPPSKLMSTPPSSPTLAEDLLVRRVASAARVRDPDDTLAPGAARASGVALLSAWNKGDAPRAWPKGDGRVVCRV